MPCKLNDVFQNLLLFLEVNSKVQIFKI